MSDCFTPPGSAPSRAGARGPCAPPRQEFWVLGSQPLAALRDAVRCPADDNMRAVGLASPAAYLHLEAAFFNDLRDPGAADLSAPVRAFCGAMRLRPPPPAAPRAEAALDAGAGPRRAAARRVQGPAGEGCELMSRWWPAGHVQCRPP